MGSDLTSATFQHFSRMEFSSSSSARQPIWALLAPHKHEPPDSHMRWGRIARPSAHRDICREAHERHFISVWLCAPRPPRAATAAAVAAATAAAAVAVNSFVFIHDLGAWLSQGALLRKSTS